MKLNTDSPPYVIGFAAIVSAVFTAAIMTLHVATADAVRRNEAVLEDKAKVELFDYGDPARMTGEQIAAIVGRRVVELKPPLVDPNSGRQFRLYKAYDGDHRRPGARLIAYAFPTGGIGFWARIDGLLAVDPNAARIVGVVFPSHSETPGLGGRISTDKDWREGFGKVKLPGGVRGDGRYVFVGGDTPPGESDPRFGRHVDAITGATGTSDAVGRFINRDLHHFLQALRKAREDRPNDLR